MPIPLKFRPLVRSQRPPRRGALNRVVRGMILWGVLTSISAIATGCGLFNDEGTIRVDSLTSSTSAGGNVVVVRAVGFVNNGCSQFKRVERSTRGDTLLRRLVREGTGGGDCIQRPEKVVHEEPIIFTPGRSIVFAVQQPDGSRLNLPLVPGAATSR